MDFIRTNETVTIIDGPRVFVVSSSQPEYQGVLDALDAGSFDDVLRLADRSRPVKAMAAVVGELTVRHGNVYWRDEIVNGHMARRILEAHDNPQKFNTLVNFFARLKRNPSYRVVEGLLNWVEKGNMKITPEGMIVAYKIVRGDYTDVHSGTMDNSIGCRPKKERNAIDDEPSKTCAESGLHFCSREYLPKFQSKDPATDRVMLLEIDPEHVVSFPKTEEAKGRACEYLVVDEVPKGIHPDDYVDAASDGFVATLTTSQRPTADAVDDSIGYKIWADHTQEVRDQLLARLDGAESEISTDAPNLPARIRAAERHLEIIVTDPDDWEDRINEIYAQAFDRFDDEDDFAPTPEDDEYDQA